ncbi:MAG: GntP family permease [candidate division KSB1 bacterium]|nr:GntP family permease [candidate division KSB1 bacterium]
MLYLIALVIVVTLMIAGSTRYRIHPFLSLLFAAIAMGFLSGMGGKAVLDRITEGFGHTLRSIGIVIACGTIVGSFLEKSGGAWRIATAILRLVGERRSAMAMSLAGFVVSIPVFCDSGFVILSPLNRALTRRTGLSRVSLAVALGTGLYATHVFVPPTPGPLAAAAALQVDVGWMILLGLAVAAPAALAGYLWAVLYARRFAGTAEETGSTIAPDKLPSLGKALAPIAVPVLLIALRSISDLPAHPFGAGFFRSLFDFLGHPVMALLTGVLLAFRLTVTEGSNSRLDLVSSSLRQAGSIVLITGSGGAFGEILRASGLGDWVGQTMAQWHLGLLGPFLIAAVLKTAQGSSTVSLITTAALTSPMLAGMGYATPLGRTLVALAIGAGSMAVSHVNDSYFWVVAQFSGMDTTTALRAHTVATLIQGLTGFVCVVLLSAILL